MSGWSLWWLVIWGVVGFGAPELAGLVLDKRDTTPDVNERRTLTSNLRWLFATDKAGGRARFRGLRRFAGIAVLGWLVVHIMTNGQYV